MLPWPWLHASADAQTKKAKVTNTSSSLTSLFVVSCFQEMYLIKKVYIVLYIILYLHFICKKVERTHFTRKQHSILQHIYITTCHYTLTIYYYYNVTQYLMTS